MTAQEAQAYGLVDAVVTSRAEQAEAAADKAAASKADPKASK